MNCKQRQLGQTLVETVVGLVVLTVGISTSLALATTIFTQSTQASKQIIAVGLAREGMEAVYNMRATNWLVGGLYDKCWDYTTSDRTAYCKDSWLGEYYDIEGDQAGRYIEIDFDSNKLDADFWMDPSNGSDTSPKALYLDMNMNSGKLYSTNPSDGPFSGYYRSVVIYWADAANDVSPYTDDPDDYYLRAKVLSRVWWTGPGCAPTNVWPQGSKCSVELSSFLTNWRNY